MKTLFARLWQEPVMFLAVVQMAVSLWLSQSGVGIETLGTINAAIAGFGGVMVRSQTSSRAYLGTLSDEDPGDDE